jgi:transposase InsO family protein
VLEFALEYGAPGADLAAPDAKRDIGSVVAQAAPLCRAVIDRLATPTRLPDDYRRRVGETGIGLIRTSRIAAPAVLMDIAGRDALADFAPFSEGVFDMRWIGRCLKLIAVTDYNRLRPHSSLGDRPPISRVHNVRG